MQESILYKPNNTVNPATLLSAKIFLGIAGEPGTGKTTSCLTFPNPVVLGCDNGLHSSLVNDRQDIILVPIYDYEFASTVYAKKYEPTKVGTQPNRRDLVKRWLLEEATKLVAEQTLIVDSWTNLQNFFDQQTELEPAYTQQGKIDDFAFWGRKIDYSRDIMILLQSLKCNVIVTFHELKARDTKTGQLLEKIQPFQQGKFITQLKVFFPNFFRSVVQDKSEKDKETQKVFKNRVDYVWQVKSNELFDAKSTLTKVKSDQLYIPADYKSYLEYK